MVPIQPNVRQKCSMFLNSNVFFFFCPHWWAFIYRMNTADETSQEPWAVKTIIRIVSAGFCVFMSVASCAFSFAIVVRWSGQYVITCIDNEWIIPKLTDIFIVSGWLCMNLHIIRMNVYAKSNELLQQLIEFYDVVVFSSFKYLYKYST